MSTHIFFFNFIFLFSPGEYNATIRLSGLTSRAPFQTTEKTQVQCQIKGNDDAPTNYITESSSLSSSSIQDLTISGLKPDVNYVFVCVSINDNGEISETTSEDVPITQSSSAPQTKPLPPTITSITRNPTTGEVVVVVKPDDNTIDTDVTAYSCTASNQCDATSSPITTTISLSSKTHTSQEINFGKLDQDGSGIEYSFVCSTTVNLASDASSPSILSANENVAQSLPTTAPSLTAGMSSTLQVDWIPPADVGFRCSVFASTGRDTHTNEFTFDYGAAPAAPSQTPSKTLPITMSFGSLDDGTTYSVRCYVMDTHQSCYGKASTSVVGATPIKPSIESVTSDPAKRQVVITMAQAPPTVQGLSTTYECKSDALKEDGSQWSYGGTISSDTPKNVMLEGLSSGSQSLVCRSTNSLGSSGDSSPPTTPTSVVFRPSVPLSLSITRAGATGLTTIWDAPTDGGGALVNMYRCQAMKEGEDVIQLEKLTTLGSGTARTLEFQGLTSGLKYDVRCSASNDGGTNYGTVTAISTSPTVGSPPTTPTISSIVLVEGTSTVRLTLSVTDDSTPAVETYTCTDQNENILIGPATVSPGDNFVDMSNLVGGIEYNIKCMTTSKIGDSINSNVLSITPLLKPGAPTVGTITRPTTKSLTIPLTDGSNGGGVISNYQCIATSTTDPLDIISSNPSSTSSSPFLDGLSEGGSYTLQCHTKNEVGWGAKVDIPKTWVGATPSAPSLSSSYIPELNSEGNIIVRMTKVVSQPPVIKYTCTIVSGPDVDKVDVSTMETETNLDAPAVIFPTTLAYGAYDFKCSAMSELDTSPESETTGKIDKAMRPSPPIIDDGHSSISRKDSTSIQIQVTWPTDNGGKSITTTTCSAKDKSDELIIKVGTHATLKDISIEGLTAGSQYEVSCTVANSVGTSDSSTIVDDVFAGLLPGVPNHANGVTSGGSSDVPEYQASSPGQVTLVLSTVTSLPPVTKYECVVVAGPEIGKTASSSTINVVFADISSYPASSTFKCRAVNAIGTSELWSAVTSPVSPKGYPGAPTNVRTETPQTSKDGDKLLVQFDEPNANGGSNILKYKCTCMNAADNTNVETKETIDATIGNGLLFEELVPNEKVNIQCFSYTEEGWSQNGVTDGVPDPASDSSTPYSVPNAPKTVAAVANADKSLKVTITPSDTNPSGGPRIKYKCWSSLHEEGAIESDYDATSIVLTNLEAGKSHVVQCVAKNEIVVNFFSGQTSSSSSGVLVKALPLAPTISSIRPGDGKVTLEISNNNAEEESKYFSPTNIQCWETRDVETKDDDGTSISYTSATQSLVMENQLNGREVTYQCVLKTAVGNSAISSTSLKATPGTPMQSCLSVDSESNLTLEQLRQQIADELGVDVSQVILEEDTSTSSDSCGGGRRRERRERRERRRLVDLSKYKVTIVLADTSKASETSKALESTCSSLNLGASCKSDAGTIDLDGFSDAALKTLKVSTVDTSGAVEETFSLFDPPFNSSFVGPYSMNVDSYKFKVEMVLRSQSVQQGTEPVQINDQNLPDTNSVWITQKEKNEEDGTFVDVQRYQIKTAQQIGGNDKLNDKSWIKNLIISVTSPDGSKTIKYTLRVHFAGSECRTEGCNEEKAAGKCNQLSGECDCESGWFDGFTGCDRYCPKVDGLKCGNNGWCNSTSKSCECDETYIGASCQERQCPVCVHGAKCLKQQTDARKDYTCGGKCNLGWGGSKCDVPQCPNDCSVKVNKANVCETSTGTCTCAPGFAGNGTSRYENDCSQQLPKFSPLATSIEISMVWGLLNYKNVYNDKGEILTEPVYDPAFTFDRAQMNRMADLCAQVRTKENLMVRPDQPCWVERFFYTNWTETTEGQPTSGLTTVDTPKEWTEALTKFFDEKHEKTEEETGNEGTTKKQYWDFNSDIVTDNLKYTGNVKMVSVRFRINIAATVAARQLKPNYTHWETFVNEWNEKEISNSGPTMIMISPAFTKMDTELRIVRSTLDSWMLSNLICLVSVLLFTQNIL